MKPLCTALLLALALIGCGKISGTPTPDAATTETGALTLAMQSSSVAQAGTTPVAFTIARDASTPDALTVHVDGLPAGVTADDVGVAAGVSMGTITFAATAASTVGSSTDVTVQLLAGTTMLDHKPFTVQVAGSPGALDTTFGASGLAVFPLPDPAVAATTGNGYSRGLVIYPPSAGADADKILIAAELETTGASSTSRKFAVVRLNPDGTPDTGFGTNGYALINGSPTNYFSPAGIALDSQQRIVVLAEYQNTSNLCTICVTRLTPAGAPDSGFTTFNALPTGGYCGEVKDVAILSGDKIQVLTYWNDSDGSQRPLLAQLNSDGSADTTRVPRPGLVDPDSEPRHLEADVDPGADPRRCARSLRRRGLEMRGRVECGVQRMRERRRPDHRGRRVGHDVRDRGCRQPRIPGR